MIVGLPRAPKVEGCVMLEDKEAELLVARLLSVLVILSGPRPLLCVVTWNLSDICAQCFVSKEDPKKGALITPITVKPVAAGSS